MTLPRRHPENATLSYIDEILQQNNLEYQKIADEILERLETDIPASLLDTLVETVIYRLGRISADHKKATQEANTKQLGLPDDGDQQHQKPDSIQPEPDRQRLKKWFLEHMSRPYPTNEEKEALAKECHMTIRQVSNWFINVRQRIWTPLARKYGVELPEQNLFVKSRVVLPEDAVQEILDAMK